MAEIYALWRCLGGRFEHHGNLAKGVVGKGQVETW